MAVIGILDPREIWSVGIAAVCRRWGMEVAGYWPSPESARSLGSLDILLLSSLLLTRNSVRSLADLNPHCAVLLALDHGRDGACGVFPPLKISGVIPADLKPGELRPCLHALSERFSNDSREGVGVRSEADEFLQLLSCRELQIARLAAEGRSNKVIAKILDLSDGTVKIHLHHVFNKLHLQSRGALACVAGLERVAFETELPTQQLTLI